MCMTDVKDDKQEPSLLSKKTKYMLACLLSKQYPLKHQFLKSKFYSSHTLNGILKKY